MRLEDIERCLASGAPVASGDDRYAVACGIADGCGVTQVLDDTAAKRRSQSSQYDLLLG